MKAQSLNLKVKLKLNTYPWLLTDIIAVLQTTLFTLDKTYCVSYIYQADCE